VSCNRLLTMARGAAGTSACVLQPPTDDGETGMQGGYRACTASSVEAAIASVLMGTLRAG